MSFLFGFYLFAVDIDFNKLDIPPPDDFVQEYIIDNIDDDFVVFLSGLAGVAAFRYLLRF